MELCLQSFFFFERFGVFSIFQKTSGKSAIIEKSKQVELQLASAWRWNLTHIWKMGNDDLNHHSGTMMTSSASTSQSSSYSSISASSETPSYGSVVADSTQEWKSLSLGSKFRILRRTDQVHELQTRLRDIDTSRSDFKFVANRLIRIVIEEGLNQLCKYLWNNFRRFFVKSLQM